MENINGWIGHKKHDIQYLLVGNNLDLETIVCLHPTICGVLLFLLTVYSSLCNIIQEYTIYLIVHGKINFLIQMDCSVSYLQLYSATKNKN